MMVPTEEASAAVIGTFASAAPAFPASSSHFDLGSLAATGFVAFVVTGSSLPTVQEVMDP